MFLAAFFASLFLTPLIRLVALKIGAVDNLELRKIHTKRIVVRLGGIAIFLAFYATILFFIIKGYRPLSDNSVFLIGMFFSSFIILLLGIYDDLRGADAKLKFFVQTVAAVIILCFGIRINLFTNPFASGQSLSIGIWGIPLTIFWIIFITNSLNLLDGLDGLAAGVCCIILIVMFCIAFRQNDYLIMALTISLAGATVGFLRYNFNPAKIFMGDTGSMFLGFTLSILSIKGSHKSATTVALLIPIIAMGLPIIDTLLAISRRILNGNNIFRADNEHIHHKLIKIGLSQKKAVLILYGISILLGMVAFLLAVIKDEYIALLLAIVAIIFFVGVKYFLPITASLNQKNAKNKQK